MPRSIWTNTKRIMWIKIGKFIIKNPSFKKIFVTKIVLQQAMERYLFRSPQGQNITQRQLNVGYLAESQSPAGHFFKKIAHFHLNSPSEAP